MHKYPISDNIKTSKISPLKRLLEFVRFLLLAKIKSTMILHYEQHESTLDDNVKICTVYRELPHEEKMSKFSIINLCLKKYVFADFASSH